MICCVTGSVAVATILCALCLLACVCEKRAMEELQQSQ